MWSSDAKISQPSTRRAPSGRRSIFMEDVTAMLFDGPDFATMTTAMRITAQHVFSSLPAPPVATAAPLAAAAAAAPDPDGVDHFDRLPADVLRSVVSRLPARDAARTTALSHRWRRVWHSVPLALLDAHLLPPAGAGAAGRALAASFGSICVNLKS
ncbi:hypothetical protein ACP70R_003634 [Stipagrostis hirtigluma subsp. patula]